MMLLLVQLLTLSSAAPTTTPLAKAPTGATTNEPVTCSTMKDITISKVIAVGPRKQIAEAFAATLGPLLVAQPWNGTWYDAPCHYYYHHHDCATCAQDTSKVSNARQGQTARRGLFGVYRGRGTGHGGTCAISSSVTFPVCSVMN